MITIASLYTFTCYGMDFDFDYEAGDYTILFKNNGDSACFNKKTGDLLFASTPLCVYENQTQPKSTLQNSIRHNIINNVTKLPQPRTPKTGYGLKFLPQDSSINRNLKSLCEDPQNIQHFKTIARFLEDVHHLNNISRERSLESEHYLNNPHKQRPLYEKSPLAGIKRVTTLLRSRKIEDNFDKSYQDALDSANKLTNKLPQPQREEILKDLDKAIENAQYNRFQTKRYS